MAIHANQRAKHSRGRAGRHDPDPAHEKENVSSETFKKQPKREKVYNANDIFEQAERQVHKRDEVRGVLSPTFSGVRKATPVNKVAEFLRAKKSHEATESGNLESGPDADPLHECTQQVKGRQVKLSLTEALGSYVEDTTARWMRQMNESREQLESARRGLDSNTGRPRDKPGVPSKEAFDALAEHLEEANQAFEDGHLVLRFKDPNNRAKSVTKSVRIGDITDKFAKRRARHKAKQRELLDEREAIDAEIDRVKEEIREDAAVAEKEMEKHAKLLEKELAAIEVDAEAERHEFRAEQRRAAKDLNRKIQELMNLF